MEISHAVRSAATSAPAPNYRKCTFRRTCCRDRNWDDLAEAASLVEAANADTLVDTHWIGGDPAKPAPYWLGVVVAAQGHHRLAQPWQQTAVVLAGHPTRMGELPPGAPRSYRAASPWKDDPGKRRCILSQASRSMCHSRRSKSSLSTRGPPGRFATNSAAVFTHAQTKSKLPQRGSRVPIHKGEV